LSAARRPSFASVEGLTVSSAGKSVFVAGWFFSGARAAGVIAVYVGDDGRANPVSNIFSSGLLKTDTRTSLNIMLWNESFVNGLIRIGVDAAFQFESNLIRFLTE
jgi:hypothetical protein